MKWLKSGLKGELEVTHETTLKIKMFSTDVNEGNSLEALMDYYGTTNLKHISEEMGIAFLEKLKNNEISL